jgi:hypothetical protein
MQPSPHLGCSAAEEVASGTPSFNPLSQQQMPQADMAHLPPPRARTALEHVHLAHKLLETSLVSLQEQIPSELHTLSNALHEALRGAGVVGLHENLSSLTASRDHRRTTLPPPAAHNNDHVLIITEIANISIVFHQKLRRFEQNVHQSLDRHSQRLCVIQRHLDDISATTLAAASDDGSSCPVDAFRALSVSTTNHKSSSPAELLAFRGGVQTLPAAVYRRSICFYTWTMRVAACLQFVKDHLTISDPASPPSSNSKYDDDDRRTAASALRAVSVVLLEASGRHHNSSDGGDASGLNDILLPAVGQVGTSVCLSGAADCRHLPDDGLLTIGSVPLSDAVREAQSRVQSKSLLIHNLQTHVGRYAKRQSRALADITVSLQDATDAARDAYGWCT